MDVLGLVAERLSAVELVVMANPVQVFNGQALNAEQCDIATDFADSAGLAPAVDVTDPYIKIR
jgi:hypothetical protein